jgi:hypothetical protein
MATQKSHFPTIIRTACVLAAVLVPTALALRGAWSIGTGVVAEQSQDVERIKNQEIRAQSRALSDEIMNEIEMIKVRSIASIGQGTSLSKELNDGSIIGLAEITKGVFLPAFLKKEIQAEIPNIVQRDIQYSGVSLFRVAIKTAEGQNALGIAFEQNNRKFLAIVNPLSAFKSIATWSNGKEGELLRGFLIDTKGQVLAHSEKTFNGKNFTNEDIFQKAIRPVFQGQRIGGVGVFAGTRASYMRLRSLPYVVVAERVLHGGTILPTYSQRLNSMLRDLKTPLISMLSVVALACFGSIFIILTAFGELSKPRARQIDTRSDAALNYFTAEQLRKAEEEFAEKTKEIEILRGAIAKSNPEITPRKPS